MNLDTLIPGGKTDSDLINQMVSNAEADVQENINNPEPKTEEENLVSKIDKTVSEVKTEIAEEVKTETITAAATEIKKVGPTAILKEGAAQVTTAINKTGAATIVKELSEQDKKRNLLYCQLYILMLGESAEMICKLISGEWEQENKYSISKVKRDEIAKAWAEVLNMELSVKSPKGALVMLIISSFIPVIFMALKTAFFKWREKKKAKKAAPIKKVETKTEIKKQDDAILDDELFIGSKSKDSKLEDDISNKKEEKFVTVDNKKTAVINMDKVTKIESDSKPEKKTRGRKPGSAKNPDTGEYELYTKIKNIKGVPFYVFSWGEEKIIPLKYRP